MYNEREALREMAKNIMDEKQKLRDEIRRLDDVYWKEVIPRIRELDAAAEKGSPAAGIHIDPVEVMKQQTEMLQVMRQLIPSLTIQQLQELAAQPAVDQLREKERETTTTTRRRTEVVEEEVTVVKKEYRDLKKDAATVACVLKEHGMPMAFKRLLQELEEKHDVTWSSPGTTIEHVMRHDPRIQRIGRGIYQYW